MEASRIYADLHLHSTVSDGLYRPSEVALGVFDTGLAAFSLTDHDTTEGLEEAARTASELGLEFIPGLELSTIWGDREMHILGYGIDQENLPLQEALARFRSSRSGRIQEMVKRLGRLGIDVSLDRVLELAGDGSVARPHLARAMVERGYVDTIGQAFDMFIGRGGPAYVERALLTPLEAVALVRDAGGIAVLAHPGSAQKDDLIPDLAEAGLAGIEAFHPLHLPETTSFYIELAEKLHLLVTGGSDSHGDDGLRCASLYGYGLDKTRYEILRRRVRSSGAEGPKDV